MEFDLFGPYGAGSLGSEQYIPRIRAAFVELKLGNTTVQVGQQNQLVIQQVPATISHNSNPVTYGAGTIAWRTPGIRLTQVVPLDNLKLTLAAEAVKNRWSNESALSLTGGATSAAAIGYGEASGMPMLQGLARLEGKAGPVSFVGYLVGVYHTVQLDGFGANTTPPGWAAGKKSITGNVIEVGGNVTFAPVNLAFNYYTGKATGNMVGALNQYGDIDDSGYWVQLAGNFTKELALSLVYGAGTPDKADLRRVISNTTRIANKLMGGMLKYQEGGYAFAVEGYQYTSTWSTTATTQTDTKGTQVIASAAYSF
jgi:hypothetical protein